MVNHFLRTVFGVGETHRMCQPDVLRWKCLAPHPFWEGSRGYVLPYKDQIAAFGCVVPCRFLTGSGVVASCCVIDWTANNTVPGAGAMLYREIQRLAGTMINVGGTGDARRVLPRIGFEIRQQLNIYTRVLRPWHHFRHARKDWKSSARLARDYREWMRASGSGSPDLSFQRVDRFSSALAALLPDPAVQGDVVCSRTPELLNYCLECPAAKMEAYRFERDAAPAGYCLISRVGRQCRIADLWVRSADARDWTDAYVAAAAIGLLDPDTTEIRAAASAPLQNAAIRRAGYRVTNTEPLFVFDPGSLLKGRNGLSINLLENDAWYWSESGA